MPTKNPRLSVTLRPELSAILDRLSKLTGNSKSAMVAELLDTAIPVFQRMSQVLEAAESLKAQAGESFDHLSAGMARAQARMESQLDLVLDDMDQGFLPILKEAEKVSRRGGGGCAPARTPKPRRGTVTPVPVTRGSGTQNTGTKGGVKGGRNGRV